MKKPVRISPEEKKKVVIECMEGNHTLREFAHKYNVHHSSIEKWIYAYRMFGDDGLCKPAKYRSYSKELREDAVSDYLSSSKSLQEICRQYQIRSTSLLQYWVSKSRKQSV